MTVISAEGTTTGYVGSDEKGDYIRLDPNYTATAYFIANALATNSYESMNATRVAVTSLIEHIRYLTATEPEAVATILKNLEQPLIRPSWRCIQAETTHDCPKGHNWVGTGTERKAYHYAR